VAGLFGILVGVVQVLIAVFVDFPLVIRGLIAASGVSAIGIGVSIIQAEIRKHTTL
jgi:hypothetical protein